MAAIDTPNHHGLVTTWSLKQALLCGELQKRQHIKRRRQQQRWLRCRVGKSHRGGGGAWSSDHRIIIIMRLRLRHVALTVLFITVRCGCDRGKKPLVTGHKTEAEMACKTFRAAKVLYS